MEVSAQVSQKQIKLKANFKNMKNKNLSSKEDRFKKTTDKNWRIRTNNHHSIETCIEAPHNEIQEKFEKTRP